MRAFAVLLLCGVALGQERAFVEVTASKDAYYVGERVRLTLRLGYDREFFGTNAVPLFPQPMDVPVHVRAQVPGEATPGADRGPTFALNDGVVHAARAPDVERDGRTFTVLEIERDHRFSEPGDVAVAAPTLRYAHATRFEEDFVSGRVAKDPKDEIVTGAPLKLRVLPLPEEGRPREFEGAVGRFTVRAEADRTSVDAGEILRLTLEIRGDGDATKRHLDLPGFHLYGSVSDRERRATAYDIAPLSAAVKEIPAIPFAFFDPGPPAGYRVVRTEPIPLEVRGRATETPPPTPPASPEDSNAAALIVIAVLLVVAIAGLLAWLRRRSGPETPPDPDAPRLREALVALRARAATAAPDLADALAAFLGAYLKCPPAGVIGPGLSARLSAAGFPPDLASRTAAALETLVAARYGGNGSGAADLVALLPEIEALLPPAR